MIVAASFLLVLLLEARQNLTDLRSTSRVYPHTITEERLMRIVRQCEYRVMPWKNGGGMTAEILRQPPEEAFTWRLSLAEINRSGPFSSFPGCRRFIMRIAGAPMTLRFADDSEHRLAALHEPYIFDGGVEVRCDLEGEHAQDLNLMIRPEEVSCTARTLRADAARLSCGTGETVIVFLLAEAVVTDARASEVSLSRWDTLELSPGDDVLLRRVGMDDVDLALVAAIAGKPAH